MVPLLSIIIPLYNKQDYILKTLNSVLSQEFKDYEIVVIDDGSTDNSVQIVKNISDKRIRLFRKENGGAASARNLGVKMAQGKWVLFLDADDTLVENMLNMLADLIHKKCFADVFSFNQFVESDGKWYLRKRSYANGYILFPFLSYYKGKIYPGPGSTVIKRSIMLKEPYREDLRRYEDTENNFRLMRKYRFYACPKPLFSYNQDSLSASNRCRVIKEDYICNLSPAGKSLFEQLAQYKLYKEACRTYPEYVEQLYGDIFKQRKIITTIYLLSLWWGFKRKVAKLLQKSNILLRHCNR